MDTTTTTTAPTGFLEETPGVKSSGRLFQALSFVFCIATPMAVWATLSVRKGDLLAIDSTVSLFCLGAFAAATGAKTIQSIRTS